MRGYFFGTTSSIISLKLWLCAQFFLIIKNVILKKHFKIKRLFWRLVSPDCKDALNTICQTLAFLLDISLKHCLLFTDNLWWFEIKWSENLVEGRSSNFPGLSTKALLRAFPWENEQHILQSHPFRGETKIRKTYFIWYHLDSLLSFTSGVVEECSLLSGNSLAVSILHEISNSGSLTFSVKLRFSNICKVSLWLSFELLSCCSSALLFLFHSSFNKTSWIIVKNLVII